MQAKPRANCRDFPPASPPISTARECRSAGMPLRHAAHKDAMQTGQAPSQLRQPEKSPLPGRERNKCREGEGEGAAERQSELRNTCDGEAQQRSWPISDRDWSDATRRSDEHTSELQSIMRSSYAVFCLKKNQDQNKP